jgi:hypothetical protein
VLYKSHFSQYPRSRPSASTDNLTSRLGADPQTSSSNYLQLHVNQATGVAMSRSFHHGSPLLLEKVPNNWHPLPLTALTRKALMESFSHYSNFSYDDKKGFVVEVPLAAIYSAKVPRATPIALREHVEVRIRLTRGRSCSTHQPGRPLEECYSWWLGQLIHYGLPLELSADEAKYAVKTAMIRGDLKVPDILKKMEQRMRTAANRRAKKMGGRLAAKRSPSKEPQGKMESSSDESEREHERDAIQISTPRDRRQVPVKIEDETSSGSESDVTSNDETSESSDSEEESIVPSPPTKATKSTGRVNATKLVPARSVQIKPVSKPAAPEASSSSENDSDDANISTDSSSDDSEYERAVMANSQAIEGASAMYGDTDTSSSDDEVEVSPIRQAPKHLEIKRDRRIRPEELEDSSDDERLPTPTPSSSRKRKRRSSIPTKQAAVHKQTSSLGTYTDPYMLSDSDEPVNVKKEPTPKRRQTSSHGKRVSLISDEIHGSQVDLVSPEPESDVETESPRNKRNRRSRSQSKSSPASEPASQYLRAVSVEIPSSASKSRPGKNAPTRVSFPSSPPLPLKGILKSSPGFRPRDSLLSQALASATTPPSSQPRKRSPELPPQPPLSRARKPKYDLAALYGRSSNGHTTKSGFQALNDQPIMRPSGQVEEEATPEIRRTLFPRQAPEKNRIVGFARQDGDGSSTPSKEKHKSKGF